MAEQIPCRRYVCELAIALVLVAVLIAITVPNYISPSRQRTAPPNACINNLRQLDSAAEQWQLENGRATNAIPTFAQVNAYIKSLPTCPSGGSSRYETHSGLPICSVPEHKLP